MLYSQPIDTEGDDIKAKPVVARFAASPTDLGTAPDITIFDPASAYGVYANDAGTRWPTASAWARPTATRAGRTAFTHWSATSAGTDRPAP